MIGKDPDWATKEAEEIFQMVVDLTEGLYDQTPGAPSVEAKIALKLSAVDQRAYARGIEEAAKVAAGGVDRYGSDPWANGYRCAAADIEGSIRQLLEGKG